MAPWWRRTAPMPNLSLGSSCELRRPVGRRVFAMWPQRQNLAFGVVRVLPAPPWGHEKTPRESRTSGEHSRIWLEDGQKRKKHSRRLPEHGGKRSGRRAQKAENTPEQGQTKRETTTEEGKNKTKFWAVGLWAPTHRRTDRPTKQPTNQPPNQPTNHKSSQPKDFSCRVHGRVLFEWK